VSFSRGSLTRYSFFVFLKFSAWKVAVTRHVRKFNHPPYLNLNLKYIVLPCVLSSWFIVFMAFATVCVIFLVHCFYGFCYCVYSITDDGRVRPKHVLIGFKKWMCYIDGQKNKYSVLNLKVLTTYLRALALALSHMNRNHSFKWIYSSARGYNWPTLFLGDINTGQMAHQVGGVSDETVKYGYGFCATRIMQWLYCKLQTRPLVREGAPQRQDSNFQTATFGQELISGNKSQSGLEAMTYWLTDRPSVVR
jgi:hypothetical protein